MSEQNDEFEGMPLSDQQLERALDRLRHPHPSPLNAFELEAARRVVSVINEPGVARDLQDMLTEWKFKRQKADDFRKRWPMIVAIFSVIGTAATIAISVVVNFFQSGGHRP